MLSGLSDAPEKNAGLLLGLQKGYCRTTTYPVKTALSEVFGSAG